MLSLHFLAIKLRRRSLFIMLDMLSLHLLAMKLRCRSLFIMKCSSSIMFFPKPTTLALLCFHIHGQECHNFLFTSHFLLVFTNKNAIISFYITFWSFSLWQDIWFKFNNLGCFLSIVTKSHSMIHIGKTSEINVETL